MSMNVSVRRIVRPGEEGNKNGNTISSSFYWRISVNTPSRPPLPPPLPMPSASLAFVPSTSQASESKANKRAADRGSHPFHAAPDYSEGGKSPHRKELGKSQARSSFPSLFCLFPPSPPPPPLSSPVLIFLRRWWEEKRSLGSSTSEVQRRRRASGNPPAQQCRDLPSIHF